jgi:adenylate cyclase
LSSLVAALLLVVAGSLIVVGTLTRERTREETARVLMTALVNGVERDLGQRIHASASALEMLLTETRKGNLDPDDLQMLADDLVDRMRYEKSFEWVAWVSAQGTGVYVQRREDGSLLRIVGLDDDYLVEEVVSPDGVESPTRSGLTGFARFRDLPWFDLAFTHERPAWSDLYGHPIDGRPARACALALRRDDRFEGVYAVGASTAFGSSVLADHWGSRGGMVGLLNPQTGAIGAHSSPELVLRAQPLLEKAVAALPGGTTALQDGAVRFTRGELEGEPVLIGLQEIGQLESLPAVVAAFIPEDDLIGFFRPMALLGLVLASGLLLLGLAVAFWVAHQVARPLYRVAHDLDRVGRFDLNPHFPPPSRIKEVALLQEAAHRMKRSLRSFGRYVPQDVVRDLLAEGGEATLGGTVRPLTLLFSDVQGFTALSEGQPPQAVVESLGAYLEVVVAAITAAGGTVDKFVGDGVVAFFNAPRRDALHAAHACEAALAMQAALAAARARWEAEGRPAFATRIGLHTDAVVVGNIGTPERLAYTVIGDGANYAARLEALNKAYGTWILASRATREATGSAFEWRRVDRTSVPGRSGGDDVYELLGPLGGVAPAVLAARDAYEAAFEHYLARRFEAAAEGFERATTLRPDDGAARVLVVRARAFMQAPPPPQWNGAVQREHKT